MIENYDIKWGVTWFKVFDGIERGGDLSMER